jgi:tetratricopeptide (TPR) repeat protein
MRSISGFLAATGLAALLAGATATSAAAAAFDTDGRVDAGGALEFDFLRTPPDIGSGDRGAQISKGMQALQAGDLEAARGAFSTAIDRDPLDHVALLGMAEVARLEGDRDGIETYLSRAVDAAPGNARSHLAWGRYLYAGGQIDRAEQALRRAAELSPASRAPWLDLGVLYLNGRADPQRAARAFSTAIQIDGTHAGAHFGLGRSLVAMNEPEAAKRHLKRAQILDPKNPLPGLALARAEHATGDADAAVRTLDQTIDRHPSFVEAHIARGDVLWRIGRMDAAAASYREAVAIAPAQAVGPMRLAMLQQARGDATAARVAYERVVAEHPEHAVAHNNLAILLASAFGAEALPRARQLAERAAALRPDAPEFMTTLGYIHRISGDLDAAAQALESAASHASAPAATHYHLGVVYDLQGRDALAVAAFRRALEAPVGLQNAADARQRLARLEGK